MVNDQMLARDRPTDGAAKLDGLFGAMANPARREMLRRLAQGDAIVSELGAPLHMSAPAVSKHLRVLEDAGLVERRRAGRTHQIRLRRTAFVPAAEFVAAFWIDAFDALEQHLDRPSDH